MGNDWVRPESVPFPIVYSRFKGKKPMPDGRVPDFWVQDATDDMADDIADHLIKYFLRDEPISKSVNAHESMDPLMRQGRSEMFKSLVRKRLTVAAFTNWPDGEPHLAGVNVIYVFRRGDEKNLAKILDTNTKRALDIIFLTLNMVDVYEKYGVEEFTTAIALSVAPEFRGQNLGVEILKARVQMTRAVGLKLTVNNFSGFASQKQAERAGFELLAEIPYPEMKDENGDERFPGIQEKSFQLRAKYIDSDEEEKEEAS